MRQKNTKKTENLPWYRQLSNLKTLPLFFRIICRSSPRLTALSFVVRIIQALIPLAMLYFGKEIIDEILRLMELTAADQTWLWTLVAIEFGLAVLSSMLDRALSLVDALLGDQVAITTSVELMQKAAELDLVQFEQAEFYDKMERARQQTTGRVILMTQLFSQFQDIITIIGLASGVLFFKPWLLVVLLVAVIPGFFSESYFNQRNYSLSRSWTPQRRELDYLRFIGASDQTAKEVKLFGLAQFIIDRFRKLSWEYYGANKAIAVKRASWGTALALVRSGAYYFAYFLIIIDTVNGLLTLGTLTFLAGAFRQMTGRLQSMFGRFSSLVNGAQYLQDLFDFMALKPTIISRGTLLPLPEGLGSGIEFEAVSFQYPGAATPALVNVSFRIEPTEKIALVGENGAGKTTIVKLLTRLYEPTTGRILLDGQPLERYDLLELRKKIGAIFQDFQRYQMTARENIGIGDIEERYNDPLVLDAAQKSLADQVLAALPGGLEQQLGRRFSNGTELSGGQWQKVALARGYMKSADLMILDEPTAALDARAEYRIFTQFAELTAGRAAVLISHRFSTVRMADKILYLGGGKIIEEGTHEELIALDGKYAELFNLQAIGYR